MSKPLSGLSVPMGSQSSMSLLNEKLRNRAQHWIDLLCAKPEREIWLHRDLERVPDRIRRMIDGPSALTIAMEDVSFQREGLRSDEFVAGIEFFGLSYSEAHKILWFCSYEQQVTVPASVVAQSIADVLSPRLGPLSPLQPVLVSAPSGNRRVIEFRCKNGRVAVVQ